MLSDPQLNELLISNAKISTRAIALILTGEDKNS